MYRTLLFIAVLFFSGTVEVAAEARLALLIGNKDYSAKIGPLKNPIQDIDLVASALTKLGFAVTRLVDANKLQMDEAIRRYVDQVRHAGPNAVSFFYYSGHGVVNPDTNVNYLIPVDLDSADTDELWYRSIEQSFIIDLLSQRAKNATHFIVFDACRNELNIGGEAAKAIGSEKGFVPINDVSGILIAYATAQKRTAADTGMFAKILSEELLKPGVEAFSVFREVQVRVKDSMHQEPWMSLNYIPRIYLAAAPKAPESPVPMSPGSPELQSPLGEAAQTWMQIKDLKDPAIFEAFRKQYGSINPVYDGLAEQRLTVLRRSQTVLAKPAATEISGPAITLIDKPKHLVRVFAGHPGLVEAAGFAPGGQIAVSGDMTGVLKFWDLTSGLEIRSLVAHKGSLNAISFSPDGKIAVSGGADGDVKIWSLPAGELIRTIPSGLTITAVSSLAEGRIIAAGCEKAAEPKAGCDHAFVKVFEPGGASASKTIETGQQINAISVLEKDRALLSCGDKIQLWDLTSGNKLRSLSENGGYCFSTQTSADGRYAIAGGAWGLLRLYSTDLAVARELKSLSADRINVHAVAISADGRFGLSGSGGINGAKFDNKTIGQLILWDLQSGEKIVMLDEISDYIRAVAFSPDGRLALSAGYERTVKIWDVSAWTQQQAARR